MKSVSDFLNILECDSILSICDTNKGIPYWFLIRNSVLRSLIGKDIYESSQSFYGRPASRRLGIYESVIHFVRTFWKLSNKRKTHVIIFPSESGFYSDDNGVLCNRYVDEFIKVDPDISYFIIGSTAGIRKGAFVGLPSNYVSMSLIDIIIKFWGYVFQSYYKEVAKSFIFKINSQCLVSIGVSLDDMEVKSLANQLARRLASLNVESLYYRFLLYVFKPHSILYEEGHYQHRVVLTQVAREMEIIPIEYQHGIIHENHDAYTFSCTIKLNKAYATFLPSYLLTYGNYWHSFCSTPTALIAIGNPYRESRVANYEKNRWLEEKTGVILVIGDGIDTDRYMKFADALNKEVGISGKVIFRPHPLERNSIEALIKINEYDFVIDQNEDLYATLMIVDTVVTEMSTVLFEATGIVKNVFSLASQKTGGYYTNIPFDIVYSVSDITSRLINGVTTVRYIEEHEIWANDWQSSYQCFARKILKNYI
jgi:hypothetical protein